MGWLRTTVTFGAKRRAPKHHKSRNSRTDAFLWAFRGVDVRHPPRFLHPAPDGSGRPTSVTHIGPDAATATPHMWVTTHDILRVGSVWGVPFHPDAVAAFRKLRPGDKYAGATDRSSPVLSLYHGTARSNVASICAGGLRLPRCKPGCDGSHHCRCHMMGKAIYLGMFHKAARFALQTPDNQAREAPGAVVRVAAFLGRFATQPKYPPCSCCGKPFVDHAGLWMKRRRPALDCLHLADHSLPATRVEEWCHRRPASLRVLDHFQFSS